MLREESKDYESVALARSAFSIERVNQELLDSFPFPAMLISKDRKVVAANIAARESGINLNEYCWDTFAKKASLREEDRQYFESNKCIPENGIKCTYCMAERALEIKKTICRRVEIGGIGFETYWAPITESVFLHFSVEMTL